MDTENVQKHLTELNGWGVKENKIHRVFQFVDFGSAIKFVNATAEIAEREKHHPDIYIFSYNKVEITLWTHAINGLSLNDFILAAQIDKIKK